MRVPWVPAEVWMKNGISAQESYYLESLTVSWGVLYRALATCNLLKSRKLHIILGTTKEKARAIRTGEMAGLTHDEIHKMTGRFIAGRLYGSQKAK